jgi:hypothetical protein
MAWGVFKKIKSGIQKAGNYLKQGLKQIPTIAKKALNFGTKAMPFIATAANAIVPGSGSVINSGWNSVNNTLNSTGIRSWIDENG